jgi:ABC-type multidrug transport system fused ATPase/permease subunit
MNSQMANPLSNSILVPLRLFLREFAAFAGARGLMALLFIFLGTIVEGVGLVLLIPFLSVIVEAQNVGGWLQSAASYVFALFSAESRFAKLSLLVVLFAALMIARAVIITVRDVTMEQLEVGFIQQIRSRITRRLAAARWDTVARLRHSRIIHLMGAGIQQLDRATSILLQDTVAIIMLASQIVLAFLLAPLLTALALGVGLLGTAMLLPMVRRARGWGSFVTNANLSLIDDMTQFLGALKLAISQNLQESFTREFEATLDELKAQQIYYVRQQTITRLTVATLSGVVGAIFILLGIMVFDISASVLIILLLILSRMSAPAMQLQLDIEQIAPALSVHENIRELESDLATAESAAAYPSDSTIVLPDGPIVFNKVLFLHDPEVAESGSAGGVRDLDLMIEPGSIVGITGPSGAGKTTFADLLVGLYPPQFGEIRVGGIALRGPAVTAWRNCVSYVAQDPFLFHDTIRRNLLWANPHADEAALWGVLRTAGAEDIVRNAAQGLDTVVGERGALLSGGERQRLCLARAMLRRPRLLVLDEAASAIDIEGEHELLERLLRTTPRLTIVMIAHRLESLRHCQRVIVFERGRIISGVVSPKANANCR